MKIACQSCQAKYTIADEKVVGKVVKIRCKKCGSTIVVNGQDGSQAGAASEEATEVRGSSADFNASSGEAGGDAEGWTVNVGDNDQRTMTTAQVVGEFRNGTITDETYCWRDGMGDWLPLREIEELSQACGLTAAASFARQPTPEPAPAAHGSVRPAAGLGGGGGGLFGNSPAPMGAQAAPVPAAARRANGRAGGADLFGGAAEAGGENDVMTSAPQSMSGARVAEGDGKMTGQRNENSVLFSLNALTSAEAQKGPKPGGMAGAAEGDGSGLIDIRALSSAMGTGGPKKSTNHADDIMNLGGGGAFSAALAAPVLTASPMDSGDAGGPSAAASNTKLYVMFGGLAAFLLIGMVGMYFALKPSVPAVATGTDPSSAAANPAAPGSAAAATPTPSATAAATPDPAASVAANDTTPKATAPAVGVKRNGGGGGGGNAAVAVAANNPPPPPPPPAAPAGGGGGGSLESLMAKSAGGAPPPANAGGGGGGGGGSAPFDRGAAAAALGGIADGVASCKKPGGPTGDGHVSITFSPGGTVVSAIVDQPPYAGTAVGGCVAGKFRGAHVPPFSGGNLTIGKRFSIN
jgi:predicted Zn finger-like uncharacterized protein